MITVNISQSVLEFVVNKLSIKSRKYIIDELFISIHPTNRILDANPKLDSQDLNLVIGNLDITEFELFIIKKSLSLRIEGTKRRMAQDIDITIFTPESEVREKTNLYNKRNDRLDELVNDSNSIEIYYKFLIKRRLKDKIKSVMSSNSEILDKEYCPELGQSGYVFKIFGRDTIVLKNEYIIGGD